MKRIIKFFEIRFGWFLVNGNKQEKWSRYLKIKYKLPQ